MATEYVASCPVCSLNKGSNKASLGLLHPLPISSCPWSHIALAFVSGLPVSEGNTTILTVVDRFSKMVHFISFCQLKRQQKSCKIRSLIYTVYRLMSSQIEVHNSSLIFCALLGAAVSLSSGYHPQSNSQTHSIRSSRRAFAVLPPKLLLSVG